MAGADERGPLAEHNAPVWPRVRRGLIVGGVVLVAVYAFLLVSAGGRSLFDTVTLRPGLLALPLLATILSYVTMSLSYEGIARAAGAKIRSRDMLRITFVANTANYIFPTGGLSGFALRMVMLPKKNVAGGRAVLISFTQTLLTNLMLLAFIVYGLVHMAVTQKMALPAVTAVVSVVVVLTGFLALCLMMVYRRGLRDRFLERSLRLTTRLLERAGYRERYGRRVERVFRHIGEGMEFFASRPRAMLAPVFWIFLDWALTIGILYAAFYSVGYPVAYSQVAVAFSVAIVVAVMSLVPGGIGVLEGTLALTFKSVGVPLEACVLPILIFRICFYVIPALLSLLLARGAFAELDPSAAQELL